MAVTTSVIVLENEELPAQPATQIMGLGAFADLTESVAELVTPAMVVDAVEPITLEQAKEHLRVVIADDDVYISNLIVAARAMAENKLNRTIVQRQRIARFTSWDDHMPLLKPPVIAVDSIGYYDDTGGELMLDAGLFYLVESEEGVPHIELRAGEYPALDYRAHPVTVYYTAGYPVGQVPAPITQWMLLCIGTMYDNRATVVNGISSAPLGDDFARWLLQPYWVIE